jgi:hypothetical protein
VWEADVWTVISTHSVVPAGFHASQLDLNMVYKVSNKSGFFSYWGR